MRVQTKQLIPGCILLLDVKGKSNRPIIPKNTVITEEHRIILGKFLVDTVEVASKLADGKCFGPEQDEAKGNKTSLEAHYRYVIKRYRELFDKWRNGANVDIIVVRELLLPLLERMDEIEKSVYKLHHYANKEDYFYHHHIAVAMLSAYLGYKMDYAKGEWLQIGLGGFLSDSGMARIDQPIIQKQSKLTEKEMEQIKKHPMYSYRYVEKLPALKEEVKQAILQHHERMDGSGYPLGLKKDKINRFARIIAVSDTYHAMTSERLYKTKQSPFCVVEVLRKEQFSKLDPEIVQHFIKGLASFSIGTKVKLSNQQIGEIVFTDEQKPTRPMIRLDENKQIISLENHPQLFIEEIL